MANPSKHEPIFEAFLTQDRDINVRTIVVDRIFPNECAGTLIVGNDMAEALAKHITAFTLPTEAPEVEVLNDA